MQTLICRNRLAREPIPAYQGLHLRAAGKQNTLLRNLKNAAGMLRRSLKARV